MYRHPITPHNGLSRHRFPQEQVSEIVFSQPSSSHHHPLPIYFNASTGAAIASLNGTLFIRVKPESYSYNSNFTAVHSSISNNHHHHHNNNNSNNNNSNNNYTTSTLSYEELSREFYESYDPSIGLHTAAVLGGILVWLLLYLIYKTKVRRCLVHLIKKMFGDETPLDAGSKAGDGGKVCTSMARNHIPPSIVIESSPPHSQPQSPYSHDQYHIEGQECFSPYSPSGSGHGDGVIFQFPNPDQNGVVQELCQCCTTSQELLHGLPKSEIDIRSATAHWVHSMPLAARSQQDFAGLMLGLKSHGLLAMNKPCSCPLVCPRTPQPQPLLGLPHTWNNSLPVLSNSLSSQILSAYEAVINQARERDLKNLISGGRTLDSGKQKRDRCRNNNNNSNRNNNNNEDDILRDKNGKENIDPFHQRRHSCDKTRQTHLGDDLDNPSFFTNSALTNSPRPIPVTPTVMIQSSNPAGTNHRCLGSNISMSSSSSAEAMFARNHSPCSHLPRPSTSRLPSPHLLSPGCDSRGRGGHNQHRWSYTDISNKCHQRASRSRSFNSHLCETGHHNCSFRYNRSNSSKASGDSHSQSFSNCSVLSHHRSLGSHNNLSAAVVHAHNSNRLSYNCRSYSDTNCGMPDSHSHPAYQLGHCCPAPNPHRSLSADVPFSLTLHREFGSPTYSNDSNRTSLGTSSRTHSPSPYFLQVPDPHNLFRPVSPDHGCQKKHYTDIPVNGPQLSMRHCVHSDYNIAYHARQYPAADHSLATSSFRRPSTSSTAPEENISLSVCSDKAVRSPSSLGSSGLLALSSSSSHHPLPPPDRQRHRHHRPPFQVARQEKKPRPHAHHRSTGTLKPNGHKSKSRGTSSQTSLNRSTSAVIMETKL